MTIRTAQQKVWQNTDLTLSSSVFVILLCFGSGLDIYYLAFCCYLHQKFFNQHLFGAGFSEYIT